MESSSDAAESNVLKTLMTILARTEYHIHPLNKKALSESKETASKELQRVTRRMYQGKGPIACGGCGRTDVKLKTCVCHYARYCNSEHQKLVQDSHKLECKSYSQYKLVCQVCGRIKHVWTGFYGMGQSRTLDPQDVLGCCKACKAINPKKTAKYNIKIYTVVEAYLDQMKELIKSGIFISI